jgi:hypothetical protein
VVLHTSCTQTKRSQCCIGRLSSQNTAKKPHAPPHASRLQPPAPDTMFMLKKKKPQVDTTKQLKAVAWDLSKIALVFVGIRAASVFLNQES